jgi:hypothetical protein
VSTHTHRLKFDGLKFSSIKRLDFGCLGEEQTGAVMKLALQSQHRHIDLKLSEGGSIMMKLLKHELMKRVPHLYASSGYYSELLSTPFPENLIVPPGDVKPSKSEIISLPYLRSLIFEGSQEFLSRIEAKNLQTLDFRLGGRSVPFTLIQSVNQPSQMTLRPMNQLSHMTLRSMTLSHWILSNPIYLPKLASLTLYDVVFEGPLRDYFEAANLKELYMDGGRDGAIANGAVVDTGGKPSKKWLDSIPRVVPKIFSPPCFPTLETLSVSRTQLDQSFASELEQFSQLQCLKIDYYAIKHFVPAFFKRVGDKKYLPSLGVLQISCRYDVLGRRRHRIWSWPFNSRLPYKDFAERCVTRRPDLSVFCDDKENRYDDEDQEGPFRLYQRRNVAEDVSR